MLSYYYFQLLFAILIFGRKLCRSLLLELRLDWYR